MSRKVTPINPKTTSVDPVQPDVNAGVENVEVKAVMDAALNDKPADTVHSSIPLSKAEIEAAYKEHDEEMLRKYGPRPSKIDDAVEPEIVPPLFSEALKGAKEAAKEALKGATQPKETVDMKEPSLLAKVLVTGVLVAVLMLASYVFVATGVAFASAFMTAFVLMGFGSVVTVFYMGAINQFTTYVDSKIQAVKNYFAKRKAVKADKRAAEQAAAMKDLSERLDEQGLAGI